MNRKRCLILGGTAFIGLRLVQKLLDEGHNVSLLNRGNSPVPEGVELLMADRRDIATVRAVLAGRDWDIVYDVSAAVQVTSVEQISALIEMLDGHCGIYEFVSSIAAYHFDGSGLPWAEQHPLSLSRPTSYGGHKAAVERLLRNRNERKGFAYTIIRPAAVYGPNDNIPDGEMAMFKRLLEKRPVLVPHDGLVIFPYGHVNDLVDAMYLASINPAAIGEAFNVTGESVTAQYYVVSIAKVIGLEPEIVYVPNNILATIKPPLPFNHRFQKIMHCVLSINKAQDILGFKPAYSFESGHRQTYEWFLEHNLHKNDTPMVDPIWNVSWDFEREAKIIEAIHLTRRDTHSISQDI